MCDGKYPWKQIWLQMSSLPVDNFGGILSTIFLLPCQGNYMIVCCYLSKIIEHILSIIIIIRNCITYISELQYNGHCTVYSIHVNEMYSPVSGLEDTKNDRIYTLYVLASLN